MPMAYRQRHPSSVCMQRMTRIKPVVYMVHQQLIPHLCSQTGTSGTALSKKRSKKIKKLKLGIDRSPKRRYNTSCAQEWRNWQTRRLQVPVVAISCGFKSHLLHTRPQQNLLRFFLCCIENSLYSDRYAASRGAGNYAL